MSAVDDAQSWLDGFMVGVPPKNTEPYKHIENLLLAYRDKSGEVARLRTESDRARGETNLAIMARNQIISQMAQSETRANRAERERDDARRQIAEHKDCFGVAMELKGERDEARRQLAEAEAKLRDQAKNIGNWIELTDENTAMSTLLTELRTSLAAAHRCAENAERIAQKRLEALKATWRLMNEWRPGWWIDYACRECVPGGDIVKDGFQCAYHIVKALAADAEAGS